MAPNTLESLCINTIRTLSMDAVQQANSGHPGTPMALAPIAFTLYDKFMKHNPGNPHWPNRDRFILSAGHASMLLYSTLHINGYGISLDDIKQFRQLHSKCAGHPEYGLAPGIETTTGPLGTGVANSVGFAIAEKWLAQYFNRPGHEILNYSIFAVAGDGCMMEGISGEAASLAGHLGLDNLIWIYDNNKITIEGSTSLAFSEDVMKRFEAYGWFVQHITDANDTNALSSAIERAQQTKGKPSFIMVDSHIGYGAPHKQDSHSAHGEPLGEEEIKATKQVYGWDPEKKFFVPDDVKAYSQFAVEKGSQHEQEWQKKFEVYRTAFPDLAKQFELIQKRELPEGWDADLPVFPVDAKGVAGRDAGGQLINALAAKIPWLVGGAADLAPSTKTLIKGAKSFSRDNRDGRNFHFGIREHAMGAIVNGMTLSGLHAYGSGFLIFSDYMRPTFRLAALMQQPSLFVFTHDSIGVGEDGPTHQPIEQVGSLRAIPNLEVIRPADANEVAEAWKYMMRLKDKPAALILTRQALPTMDRTKYAPASGAQRGGYILADCKGKPDIILIGTGSEVQLCIGAYEKLTAEGYKCRVVSLPCWSLFERQGKAYWEKVLPSDVRCRIAVEAAASFGWRRYTGIEADGGIIAMRSFGESAPIKALLEEFGFTTEAVVKLAKQKLKQFGKAAPKKTVSAKNKPAKKAKSKPKSKSTNKKTVSKKKQTSGKRKRK
ncbi:transketolase [bacterium]|nr:transketolase [bacterium]NUN45146.1 transketolase [bacterium]